MKHNKDADHTCLQPCMMLDFMSKFNDHPNMIVAEHGRNFVLDAVKTLFDITRRDLCFGGYADWEKDLTDEIQ